jgi:6-phosphofructokinase 1
MNAAIRAVVRCARAEGWEVLGVRRGYAGLIEGAFVPLDGRAVSGTIERGGTILGSARSPAFSTEAGRGEAVRQLGAAGVDALVVIGGNGSQAGAQTLARAGVPVVGVASTIDNDLAGSDVTIGVDTALNTALDAIDRLKTTASSHERGFLVEVMGRDCGYLALAAGIAGGAEAIVTPELAVTAEEVEAVVLGAQAAGKRHAMVVVAEGAKQNAAALGAHFAARRATTGVELKVTVLGHVQRGGAPTARDRLLGSRLGAGAVAALARGERGVLVGTIAGEVRGTPYDEVVGVRKPLPADLLALAPILAR